MKRWPISVKSEPGRVLDAEEIARKDEQPVVLEGDRARRGQGVEREERRRHAGGLSPVGASGVRSCRAAGIIASGGPAPRQRRGGEEVPDRGDQRPRHAGNPVRDGLQVEPFGHGEIYEGADAAGDIEAEKAAPDAGASQPLVGVGEGVVEGKKLLVIAAQVASAWLARKLPPVAWKAAASTPRCTATPVAPTAPKRKNAPAADGP